MSVERRIGELAAVVACAEDENESAEANYELRRISEALNGALKGNGP